MKFLKFIAVCIALLVGFGAKAVNKLPLFTMDRTMIDATNAQNLAEALRYLPFFNQYIKANEVVGYSGVLDVRFVAVYKNNFPLLMDQNLNYDLTSIALWDVDSFAIFASDLDLWNKNNGGLILHLYTQDFVKKPSEGKISFVANTLGDLTSNIHANFSNAKHSVSVGTNRSFVSELPNYDAKRQTPWASSQRYDANIRYKFYILPTVTLNINLDNSWQSSLIKNEVIYNTTRVRDIEKKFNRRNYFGSLTTALSKHHTLILNGQYHQLTAIQYALDKDLHSQKQEISRLTSFLDTLGYGQGWMQILLKGEKPKFGYQVGLDITTTTDHVHRTIKAVTSAYSDYSLFGLAHYYYKDIAVFQAGSKFITSSLSGSYILPQLKVTFAPEQVIKVNLAYIRSLAYPSFQDIFYPAYFTNSVANNLLLKPIFFNSLHSQLVIQKNIFEIQTGILFSRQTSLIEKSTSTFENSGQSSGVYTYFNFKYNLKKSYIKPSLILHSISPSLDSINRIYFYPEFNIYANWNIEKWHTTLVLVSRIVGKHTAGKMINGEAQIAETSGSKLLNIAMSKHFLSDKFTLLVGANNVFNNLFVAQQLFVVQPFDVLPAATNEVLQDRGFNLFAKLNYTF